MEANNSGVSGEAQLMDELKKLEQSARQYQQEVSINKTYSSWLVLSNACNLNLAEIEGRPIFSNLK